MNIEKRVVVILPYVGNKILLQFRDFNQGIVYPGKWGFFGGKIEFGEIPIAAARRELYEETGILSDEIVFLFQKEIFDEKAISFVFYCPLRTKESDLILGEGLDLGLFSFDEINKGNLFSKRKNAYFPVIDSLFLKSTIEAVLEKIMLNLDNVKFR